jgi:hypothetical protein
MMKTGIVKVSIVGNSGTELYAKTATLDPTCLQAVIVNWRRRELAFSLL